MTQLARRSFITGLVALVAAPAIVRAGSLMPVNSGLVSGNTLLTIDQITREAVRLFQQYNQELAAIDVLYGSMTLKPGDVLTLGDADARQFLVMATSNKASQVMEDARRMYSFNNEADRKRFYANWEADYAFMTGEQWTKAELGRIRSNGLLRYNKERWSIDVVPQIPDSLALAAAAVAIAPVVLAKPVTRRFWK